MDGAGNLRSSFGAGLDIETPSHQLRPVLHNVQTHSLLSLARPDPNPIIIYGQSHLSVILRDLKKDGLWFGMLDRVVDGFLGNAVKLYGLFVSEFRQPFLGYAARNAMLGFNCRSSRAS